MTPEASALYLEDILSRIGQATGAGELRDKGVENQISTLTEAAAAMHTKTERTRKRKRCLPSFKSQT